MYKLLIYMDRVAAGNHIQTRCYMFKFNTEPAVRKASEFFTKLHDCSCFWVLDDPKP